MPEPDILDLIARKEQELRARLLAARARAEAEVVDARHQAAQLRAESDRSAGAEIEAWCQAEVARVRQAADATKGVALDEVAEDGLTDRLAGAAEIVVSAILPHADPRPLEPSLGQTG